MRRPCPRGICLRESKSVLRIRARASTHGNPIPQRFDSSFGQLAIALRLAALWREDSSVHCAPRKHYADFTPLAKNACAADRFPLRCGAIDSWQDREIAKACCGAVANLPLPVMPKHLRTVSRMRCLENLLSRERAVGRTPFRPARCRAERVRSLFVRPPCIRDRWYWRKEAMSSCAAERKSLLGRSLATRIVDSQRSLTS